jgi:hypothetical protein
VLHFPAIVFLDVDPECQFNSSQLAGALMKRLKREGAITARFDTPVQYLVQKILAPLLRPDSLSSSTSQPPPLTSDSESEVGAGDQQSA